MPDIPLNTAWKVAAASALTLGLTFLDQTAVNVALPSIQSQLALSSTMLHWVINAYLLLLAVCLVLGGTLGSRYGKKEFFLTGVSIFALASIACALSTTGLTLVMSRGLQGVGGALMMPNSFGITLSIFPDHMRGKVMGTLLSFTAFFLILGPFVGGLITQYISWHAIFWLNVPVCIASGILMSMYCPYLPVHQDGKLDWPGFILLALSVSSIVFGLMQSVDWGWTSAWVEAALSVGILAFATFIRYQLKTAHPFIDLSIFQISAFNVATLIYTGTQMVFIINVFIPVYIQRVLGFSPTQAGALGLITPIPLVVLSRYGGRLRDQYGPRRPITIGLVALVTGTIWLCLTFQTKNIWMMLPGLFGFSCCAPFVFGNANATALMAVPDRLRGVATGITSCARQVGATVMMSILNLIMVTVEASHDYAVALSMASVVTVIIASACLYLTRYLPGHSITNQPV